MDVKSLVHCGTQVPTVLLVMPRSFFRQLLLEHRHREQIAPLALLPHPALGPDFHEENLGDLVERGSGVEVLAVANDVVALVEQVGKLVLPEGAEAGVRRASEAELADFRFIEGRGSRGAGGR